MCYIAFKTEYDFAAAAHLIFILLLFFSRLFYYNLPLFVSIAHVTHVYSNWYCRGSRLTSSQYPTYRHVARTYNTLYFRNKWYIILHLYERFFTVRLIIYRKMCYKHLARVNEIILLIHFCEMCITKCLGSLCFVCPIYLCLHIAYVEFSLCYCRSVGDSSWL